MKQNKEIKKGDKIWLYSTFVDEDSFYTVISVKKVKTLVEVVVSATYYDEKEYEILMYGHRSSSMLSGYDKRYYNPELEYTCDYDLIRQKKKRYNDDQHYKSAGIALLNLAKYLK